MPRFFGLFCGILCCVLCILACENNVCPPDICKNAGKIRKIEDSCFCECSQPYLGRFCDSLDVCAQLNCQNGANCEDGKCQCPPGFTGTDCSIRINPCDNVICENDGICVDGKCSCADGYYGESCKQSKTRSIIGDYMIYADCADGSQQDFAIRLRQDPDRGNAVVLSGLPNYPEATVSIIVGNSGVKIRSQRLAFYGVIVEGDGVMQNGGFLARVSLADEATDKTQSCTWSVERE